MIDNIYIQPDPKDFPALCLRPKQNEADMNTLLTDIFAKVEKEGDKALFEFTSRFDRVDVPRLKISASEIQKAKEVLPDDLMLAIQDARQNIIRFHELQKANEIKVETTNGVICSQKSVGIQKIGIYIPGGTAPLFSTVLMLAIPAVLAGCREIVLCSPPNSEGNIDPAILYTADLCGVDKIYALGGAQAIAAMTVGTETIDAVYKIFGPGNQYVTAAKQFAARYGVAMDSPAGPSELLVFADRTSNPEFVAADLLSQAEHGVDSQVMLVSKHLEVVQNVIQVLNTQLKELPRKEMAEGAIQNSKAIVFADVDHAIDFINEYGPEHLILAVDDYQTLLGKIVNAGSVFLGHYCPESAGDYASGTNHTLPTDGWVKSCSGTNIDSFTKKITYQEISKEGIQNLGNTIMKMAEHEGLVAHKKAVEIRLNQLKFKN